MSDTLEYLRMYARLPFALRRFLQHSLTLEEARAIVHERMARREENFLTTVAQNVYGNPRSPYLALLKRAGCESGDLRTLVGQRGVEGALVRLREEGVYVTFEEFKGRKPIVRGGLTLKVSPRDFNNQSAQALFIAETGGSTGAPMRIAQDLTHSIARAPYHLIYRSVYGILGAPAVMWRGIIPDSAITTIVQSAQFKSPPVRWFSPIGWRDAKSWVKYDLATCFILFWLRLYGARVPFPEYVPLGQAVRIARALVEIRKKHPRVALHALISPALRVAQAAQEAGLDLSGVVISGGGEPPTPTKVREIERSGAKYFSNYAMAEAKVVAFSCAAAEDKSDVHLLKDGFALITHPHTVESVGITVPSFHLTSLLESAPKILFNLEVDDYGIVEERACGCEFDAYGFTTHLRQIRSYSKLVSEGATLLGSDMVHLLEEVLPARFGGRPSDYQMMEEEDGRGFTRLSLVISPRVAISDEREVIDFMLKSLRAASPMADAARSRWAQAETFQIKRQEPVWTARGKLMPLHIERAGNKAQQSD